MGDLLVDFEKMGNYDEDDGNLTGDHLQRHMKV